MTAPAESPARPDGVFQTEGRVPLALRPVSPGTAEDHGCPGATHLLVGRHTETFGTVASVTGKAVRVPGWTSARLGVLSVFTPWGGTAYDPEAVLLRGWVGQ